MINKRLNSLFYVVFSALKRHLTAGSLRKIDRVDNPETLQKFLVSRANHVTQVSLYGYLKTRAGLRYFELFTDDIFAASISIARWQLWLACLSDLCVYCGAMIGQRTEIAPNALRDLMSEVLADILSETGTPADAGPDFTAGTEEVRERIATVDWGEIDDKESAFSKSPAALVHCAPIIDELKELDAGIVTNSVRFRWQEVRRDFRTLLDASALVRGIP